MKCIIKRGISNRCTSENYDRPLARARVAARLMRTAQQLGRARNESKLEVSTAMNKFTCKNNIILTPANLLKSRFTQELMTVILVNVGKRELLYLYTRQKHIPPTRRKQ